MHFYPLILIVIRILIIHQSFIFIFQKRFLRTGSGGWGLASAEPDAFLMHRDPLILIVIRILIIHLCFSLIL